MRFNEVGFGTIGEGVTTAPFAFVILPRTAKDVVLEENIRNDKGERRTWKELARVKHAR